MSRTIDPREQHARRLARLAGEVLDPPRPEPPPPGPDPRRVEAGRKGAAARLAKYSPEERQAIARRAWAGRQARLGG